jgi:hypothetical protein
MQVQKRRQTRKSDKMWIYAQVNTTYAFRIGDTHIREREGGNVGEKMAKIKPMKCETIHSLKAHVGVGNVSFAFKNSTDGPWDAIEQPQEK